MRLVPVGTQVGTQVGTKFQLIIKIMAENMEKQRIISINHKVPTSTNLKPT